MNNNRGQTSSQVSFLIRWLTCSLGLWIAVQLFGSKTTDDLATIIATFLLAGLIFSAVNSILKPLVTILSLPFMLLSLGLFMLVVNGFMVWITVAIAPNIQMGFGWAIVSSLVISLINYLASSIGESERFNKIRR